MVKLQASSGAPPAGPTTLPMPLMDIVKPLKLPRDAEGTELFWMIDCDVNTAWQVCWHQGPRQMTLPVVRVEEG